jgi:competence protein ComEA
MNHPEIPARYHRPRAAVWGVGFIGLFLVLVLASALRATGHPQDPRTDAFVKVCSDCHEPDRIVETRRTRSGWEEIIIQMIDKGAVGSNQDFTLVLQYLLWKHGMVNVNGAEPDEIALVTGLTLKEAEAIVAHRKASGDFKSFDALLQVPNIDVKKLEESRKSLLF